MQPHYEGSQPEISARTMMASAPVPTSGLSDKRTGRPISSREPLVMNKPNGGWIISFVVNGIPMSVAGTTAAEAIGKERKIIVDNRLEEQWDEDEAWRQANLQWLNATNPKYHRVDIAELLGTAKKEPEPEPDDREYPPSHWGSIAWKWLGLVLAGNRYDAAKFITSFRQVVDLMNPAINPALGCRECHAEASKKLAQLQASPPKTIGDARRFLFEFHNEVNKRIDKEVITFEQAETINFWR